MFTKIVAVLVFIEVGRCHIPGIPEDLNNIEAEKVLPENITTTSLYLSGLRYIHKVYRDCSTGDFSTCIKLKLISVIDRVGGQIKDVPLLDGVMLTKDTNNIDEDPIQTVSQIEESLPRSYYEKDEALNKIIMDKLFNIFKSHTLQIKLPSLYDLTETSNEEGRVYRRRRNNGLLMLPLILIGTLLPIALGSLAMFAGKALLVSKLALVLASIIGLKKLLGGGNEKPHEVYISSGHDSHSRSYTKDPRMLAYKAYLAQ